MEKTNRTLATSFVLVGLSEDPKVQIALFILFFWVFLTTVLGNITLLAVCIREPRLHTPMYFFLVNLSILDVCISSVTVPNMLVQLLLRRRISLSECAAQMYAHSLLGITECILLAVMAYDRYVAILFPLRYTVIMNKFMFITLAACCWLGGIILTLIDSIFILRLPLCGSGIINHYICDAASLIRLACVDTFITQVVIICVAVFALIIPSLFTLISYIRIVATILGIRSTQGRYKAFSTCASHLIVVTIFYSTAMFVYMKPVSKDTADRDKIISVFYTVTPPMLNPVIYSLRNKDVKCALRKILHGYIFH